jgi:hypothetical protein
MYPSAGAADTATVDPNEATLAFAGADVVSKSVLDSAGRKLCSYLGVLCGTLGESLILLPIP